MFLTGPDWQCFSARTRLGPILAELAGSG